MGIFRHPASSIRRDRFSVRRDIIAFVNYFVLAGNLLRMRLFRSSTLKLS